MEKYTQQSLENYLNALAGDQPVPGGGSVSAYVAALAMGLSQMVIRITLKRKLKEGASAEEAKKDAARRAALEKILNALEKARRDAFQIVNLDPQVYDEVRAAYKNPEKMEDALQNSFRLQADLAFLIVMAREWNNELAGLASGSVKNDLLVSAAGFPRVRATVENARLALDRVRRLLGSPRRHSWQVAPLSCSTCFKGEGIMLTSAGGHR